MIASRVDRDHAHVGRRLLIAPDEPGGTTAAVSSRHAAAT
jgi:hypothetical protein